MKSAAQLLADDDAANAGAAGADVGVPARRLPVRGHPGRGAVKWRSTELVSAYAYCKLNNRIQAIGTRIRFSLINLWTGRKMHPDEEPSYYTDAVYHTSFPGVNERINSAITGQPYRGWIQHVSERYGPLGRVLALNCGNGWVERALYGLGAVSSVIGVDISETLLGQARASAIAENLPFEYRVMDANAPTLASESFDCVLNYAALHHVTYMDRMVRALCQALPEHGLLINYDYVGPDRNQYPWSTWSQILQLWSAIPEDARSNLVYPHCKTLLRYDPSEAAHSELILETVARYFETLEEVGLDGSIAYPLLFQNRSFLSAVKRGEHAELLRNILDSDHAYSKGVAARSFFVFQVCKVRKSALSGKAQLDAWSAEEEAREAAARQQGGRYKDPTLLELVYNEVADLQYQLNLLRPTNV